MDEGESCGIGHEPNMSGVTLIELAETSTQEDYRQAMARADALAAERLGDYMLLSWYDRDRDFESPQHASECHQDSATPGYVDYGLHHGATLKVDIGQGRFVFFYMPVDLQA